jgi:SnoaL-like domain
MLVRMDDVYIGEGHLAGRGVYANRAFAEGEVVLSYRLRRLSRQEYLALPETERLFVHSYWGERHLYPPPACYVNHADSPNTYQDFDEQCDIAVRRIEAGEFITTDAHKETDRELTTFLTAYQTAFDSGDYHKVDSLIDDQAVLWLRGRASTSKEKMIEAFRHATAEGPERFRLFIRQPRWIIGTGRWEAVCSHDLEIHDQFAHDARSIGHVTDVVKVIDGNWQIIYRHESVS